jgi:hypothetical protein
MRSKTLIGLAVAGTFACAGAFAGSGAHHGAASGSQAGYEVHTPLSVNESAPWLGSHSPTHSVQSPGTIGFQEGQFSDGPVGTSAGWSGTGSDGYDYQSAGMTGSHEMALSDSRTIDSGDSFAIVEYWLLGDEPSGTGRSSSTGGSGTGGFNSLNSGERPDSMSGSGASDDAPVLRAGPTDPLSFVTTPSAGTISDSMGELTPLVSEHYLVYGPLSSFHGQDVIVLEVGPTSEDIALLDTLSRDFYVLTPVYDEG